MILKTDNNIVHLLIYRFYWSSLDMKLQPAEALSMTWSKQEEFLNATIKHPRLVKYPMRNEFVRLFLKKLIGCLEATQEVHDDLYTYMCKTNPTDSDKPHYRHYIIGNDLNNIVILKETNNLVLNGTTGMRTWAASFILTDWALCHKEVFQGKVVLELGSGIGFTGITISRHCQPKKFFFSDCHIDVLNTISENIYLNLSHWKGKEEIEFNTDVKPIDWTDVNTYPLDVNPDVLIGADIVYDPCISESLSSVFKFYSERNKNIEIYIAGVLRNEETYDLFVKSLECCNLQYEEITLKENKYLHCNKDDQQYLLKIKKHT